MNARKPLAFLLSFSLLLVLLFSVGGFALLTLLAALGRKPLLMLIWDLLLAAVLFLIELDFRQRGVGMDGQRIWGISHGLYAALAAFTAVCGVWMLVERNKGKTWK